MSDALTFFEIPTVDIDRAGKFYEEVLQVKLAKIETGGDPMRLFPAPEPFVRGALVCREEQKPSMGGTLVYLRLLGNVDAAIARVKPAGGSVIMPKMTLSGVPGEFFCLRDTEGNLVGVHGA